VYIFQSADYSAQARPAQHPFSTSLLKFLVKARESSPAIHQTAQGESQKVSETESETEIGPGK
jgi:hypothetical protein